MNDWETVVEGEGVVGIQINVVCPFLQSCILCSRKWHIKQNNYNLFKTPSDIIVKKFTKFDDKGLKDYSKNLIVKKKENKKRMKRSYNQPNMFLDFR